jgi:hypothetical protein
MGDPGLEAIIERQLAAAAGYRLSDVDTQAPAIQEGGQALEIAETSR